MAEAVDVPRDDVLRKLSPEMQSLFAEAQTDAIEREFATAGQLLEHACADLKLALKIPGAISARDVGDVANSEFKILVALAEELFQANETPEQNIGSLASQLAHRVQLLRAFRRPELVIEKTVAKVAQIVERFPQTAAEIECGRNRGDVLDPYIMVAAQQLVYGGNFQSTVGGVVAHKVLMMIEGLIGHLHEDVIGAMRGNVRVPEPRGDDQESLHFVDNPFPGADIVQPPIAGIRPLRFHQVKSKTGSAKGGDAPRLGQQLRNLPHVYGGESYYDALIGNTLQGHRSMAGVLRAAPDVVVLVGEAAFKTLTGSSVGPELLLRVYQAAFEVAARRGGYKLEDVTAAIYATFQQQAADAGEGFLEAVLHRAIRGAAADQDSRLYRPARRGRKPNAKRAAPESKNEPAARASVQS